MNNRFLDFVKNFIYTISSNLISTIISVATILILPRVLSTEAYGYIQLYIFYVSYTTYLSFGIPDGIYIRYGGEDYNRIDKNMIAHQHLLSLIIVMFFSFIITFILFTLNFEIKKLEILVYAFLSAIAMVPRLIVTFTLMTTNRMKLPAIVTIIERASYAIGIILLILLNIKAYKFYIAVEILGKLFATTFIFLLCKEMFIIRNFNFSLAIKEINENFKVGINIVASAIASILIIGIIRFNISSYWSISVFGKVSLILSISSFLLVFVNSVAVVIFPVLCRMRFEKLKKIFHVANPLLQVSLIVLLMLYFPIEFILMNWLPKYTDSIAFLAIVFPICIFESKFALLMNTYFKILRKEKMIFKINAIVLLVSLLMSTILIRVFGNLYLAVGLIPILLGFRCLLSESILGKYLDEKINISILMSLLTCVIFIIDINYLHGHRRIILYLLWCIFCVYIERKKFVYLYNLLKSKILKGENLWEKY